MPNIRSQRVDSTGISIVASDGRSTTITKAQIQAFYQSTNGNAASRKAQTITWAKQQIESALGAEQVPQAILNIYIDTNLGELTSLQIGG